MLAVTCSADLSRSKLKFQLQSESNLTIEAVESLLWLFWQCGPVPSSLQL